MGVYVGRFEHSKIASVAVDHRHAGDGVGRSPQRGTSMRPQPECMAPQRITLLYPPPPITPVRSA